MILLTWFLLAMRVASKNIIKSVFPPLLISLCVLCMIHIYSCFKDLSLIVARVILHRSWTFNSIRVIPSLVVYPCVFHLYWLFCQKLIMPNIVFIKNTFLILAGCIWAHGTRIKYSESVNGMPFTGLSLLSPEFLLWWLVALFFFFL